jgi:hypothetical protein
MTFLNPLYLIALAAAAIPIILHLLNLRKTRVIEFSTLAFLKELQRSKIRKLQIKQWILLALRTLIIVFIVLAFTRPALRSSFGFLPGTQAKTSIVIVLDDSFSMFASDDGGQLFKQAKDKARAILDVLKPGDEVALIRLSESQKEQHAFTAAVGAVRNELDAMEPSFRHADMTDALTAASVLLQKSNNYNKEVYVVSDEQRTHYFSEKQPKTQALFTSAVKLFLVPLGARKMENTAMVDVRVENAIFEKGSPVDITATILNDGGSAITNGIASVFLNGERITQKAVDVDAGARKTVQFNVVPQQTGFVQGFVELEDDRIPEDNRRYFAFHIPENLRILLGSSGTQEASILQLALQPDAAGDKASPFVIDAVDRGAISSANLAKYDVVVLPGAAGLSDGAIQRLASYAKEGGSLLVMPDGDGSTDVFARSLLPALGMPAASGANGTLGKRDAYTSFGRVDFDHPLFKNVFQAKASAKRPEVESPHLYYSLKMSGSESAQPVITTANGDAFLLDRKLGRGRVLAFAVSPNLRWSDFPFKGVFVPLINRAMFYLSTREDFVQPEIVGRSFDLALPPSTPNGVFDLKSPDGQGQRMIPKNLPTGLYFSISSIERPGVYDLASDKAVLRKLPVNIDAAESDMTKISAKDRTEYFRSIGVETTHLLDRDANIRQAVTEARFGVELWKYMLGLAILCALLEMTIARDRKRALADVPAE